MWTTATIFFKSRLGITNDNLSNSLMMTSAQVFESSVTTTKFKFTFIWAIALLDQLLLLSSNYLTFLICHFFIDTLPGLPSFRREKNMCYKVREFRRGR